MTTSNFGRYGDPNAESTDRPSAEWPALSQKNYLWEGRFWVGAQVDGEIRVSHADYGSYEWYPNGNPNLSESIVLGIEQYEVDVSYQDTNESFHSTAPLNLKVLEKSRVWQPRQHPELSEMMLTEQQLINIGDQILNDLYISWVFDFDVGMVYDNTSPHIDDLVDYDGYDGADTDTDKKEIVENYDWNNNGILDGYDANGIPYGWRYVGSRQRPNPNYDSNKIHPDGYPDEFQILFRDGDTLRVSRKTSYMYDADNPATPEDDTIEKGKIPGFIGVRLLNAPRNKVSGHQWWNWETDPGSDKEKYQYMARTHPASEGQQYRDNPLRLGADPFDYRTMTTTGPYRNFAPGDTINLAFGVIVGKGLEGMRKNADYLAAHYKELATIPVSIGDGIAKKTPRHYQLGQNYPNPFNTTTRIEYELPKKNHVTIDIFNVLGRKMKTLVDRPHKAGRYEVIWDGANERGSTVSSGLYFYRLKTRDYVDVRRMLLIK